MAEEIVSLVVEKLGDLLLEKLTFSRDVRGQLERLQKELRSMKLFMKTADSHYNHDQNIRDLVADVRDIAYDVEDIIDAFHLKVASKEGESSDTVLMRCICKPKKLFNLNNIGKEIDIIFAKIVDISRRPRYGITSVVQREGTTFSLSSEMPLRQVYPHTEDKDDDTVGLEDQTKTMVDELQKEEDRLCVVSIHGMEGLGKSTLAKKVYNHRDIKNHFDCYAWTSISKTLNSKTALQEILRKVSTTSEDMSKMKEDVLFEKINKILQTNRYLVVLDDVWSKEAWDALKPAFPNNKGSKVMITTHNLEVAKHADRQSFHLAARPLTDDEAWKLLRRKAFPSRDFEECGRNMLKQCHGSPLQVILLGGILASKGTIEEWEVVSKQIGTHKSHSQGDKVFSILSLSYTELPYTMKPLFLYLGLFPEDFLISVKKLVRMWIAESLIGQENEGETIKEVGTRYLDELIHRSMVQIGEKSMGGEKIKTCRLHNEMRKLCITIGREENFFEVVNGNGDFFSSFSLARTSSKIRRYAIYIEGDHYVFPKESSRSVRTAYYFIQVDHSFYFSSFFLNSFKLLRVLELAGSLLYENKFVRVVEKLSNLRYLCIGGYCGRIGISFKNLVFLQTLDLRGIHIDHEIPNRIMPQLIHFYGIDINLSNVSPMKNLQTLFQAWPGPWMVHLDGWINLERLGICGLCEKTMGMLTTGIGGGGLDKLRSLYLRYGDSIGYEKGFSGFSSDLLEALCGKPHLQKLKLYGKIQKLPSKFPSNLIKLSLYNTHFYEDPMPTLERLKHLLFLKLRGSYDPWKSMVFSAEGFPKLQYLKIGEFHQLEECTVDKEAMPYLATCVIICCKRLKMVPQGFKFLTMLQELTIRKMPKSFKERVKQGGEDWETIKHIPSISTKKLW